MILRRKEFKRAREYRRRAAKRKPLPRLFRDLYRGMRAAICLTVPEYRWFRATFRNAPSGSTTTPVTAQAAVLVHYGDAGGALS